MKRWTYVWGLVFGVGLPAIAAWLYGFPPPLGWFAFMRANGIWLGLAFVTSLILTLWTVLVYEMLVHPPGAPTTEKETKKD